MNGWVYVFTPISILLLILLFTIFIRMYLPRLVDKRICAYQSDLLQKHYDEVQNIYRQMRGWRHDYHNHIQVIKARMSLGETEKLEDYLNELDTELTTVDTMVKTGNIMLDAILNSKLSLASTRKIAIDATANAPSAITVSDVELCTILGNLLDNAIEACCKIENQSSRFIRVYIGALKGQLYISVSNSVGTELRKQGARYLTTKTGIHGFGLISVDRIVEKYKGFANRQNEPGVFATEIMLPL